jgi:hypothetical protein
MQESESPYVYIMIDELVPKYENKNETFLFAWNRLPYDKKEIQSTVKILNSFLIWVGHSIMMKKNNTIQ